MFVWWAIFCAPLLAVLLAALLLFRERRSLSLLFISKSSLALGIASPMMGIYGIIHIGQMLRRDFFDYAFERRAWDLAGLGFILTVAWLILQHHWRNLPGWICLSCCFFMLLVWSATPMTL
jgi:hypothetical protein